MGRRYAGQRSAVPALAELPPDDPATLATVTAVRRECAAAKVALSADTEVTIPVLAPGFQSQVRLVRAEFEDLIRAQVADTVQALRHALRSAHLDPSKVDVVLLVGGSSRSRWSPSSSPGNWAARWPSPPTPRPRSRSARLGPTPSAWISWISLPTRRSGTTLPRNPSGPA